MICKCCLAGMDVRILILNLPHPILLQSDADLCTMGTFSIQGSGYLQDWQHHPGRGGGGGGAHASQRWTLSGLAFYAWSTAQDTRVRYQIAFTGYQSQVTFTGYKSLVISKAGSFHRISESGESLYRISNSVGLYSVLSHSFPMISELGSFYLTLKSPNSFHRIPESDSQVASKGDHVRWSTVQHFKDLKDNVQVKGAQQLDTLVKWPRVRYSTQDTHAREL